MVFQAAMNSLNPVHRVADQVAEAIETHERLSRAETDIRVTELFEMVGLDPDLKEEFPSSAQRRHEAAGRHRDGHGVQAGRCHC